MAPTWLVYRAYWKAFEVEDRTLPKEVRTVSGHMSLGHRKRWGPACSGFQHKPSHDSEYCNYDHCCADDCSCCYQVTLVVFILTLCLHIPTMTSFANVMSARKNSDSPGIRFMALEGFQSVLTCNVFKVYLRTRWGTRTSDS